MYYYADYHTHTAFSSDSSTPMERMVEQGIALGLKEIAITDHIDFDYPDPEYPFLFEYEDYKRRIVDIRSRYSERIKILMGVEIGIQPHVYKEIQDFVSSNHFDFIIGSTHCVEKEDLYEGKYFKDKTQHDAYYRYFEDVLRNIKECAIFNVYGHVDFINRYGPYDNKTMVYNEFKDITDEILKELIAKGKGIEINTSGFRYGLGHTHPQLPLVQRYKELGGEIITIGSDAHIPEHITSDFRIAYNMLKTAGFQYFTTFENQQPKFIKL